MLPCSLKVGMIRRAVEANLEDGLQQLREEFAGGASEGAEHGNAFEAARKADQGLCSLERKLTGQVEDGIEQMGASGFHIHIRI